MHKHAHILETPSLDYGWEFAISDLLSKASMWTSGNVHKYFIKEILESTCVVPYLFCPED
jgi:hypothetical protein